MSTFEDRAVDVSYSAIEELAAAGDCQAAAAALAGFSHLFVPPPPSPPPPRADAAEASAERPALRAIGPWRPEEHDGGIWFVKDPQAPWGWAAVERVPLRTAARKRIVLIGESVARTLLLDPLYHCAAVLRALCDHAGGAGAIEIVDLARNALIPPDALDLMDAAGQLSPDLYIVYAGNNLLAGKGVYEFDRASTELTRAGSWHGADRYVRDVSVRHAHDYVTRLATIARAQHVPLLYVVPAYNQRDWASLGSWTNPAMAPADRRLRNRHAEHAERLLDEGRLDEAEAAAHEVVRLEDDLSPHGLRLLARVAMARQDGAKAATLYDRAVDAAASIPTPSLLVCTPLIAEALRERCRAEDVPFVDATEVFTEARPGEPCGRELFLDNVHTSALGVRLVMAAVAERLLAMLDLPRQSRVELLAAAPEPSADAEAQAHFLAALFNSQQGQTLELIRYHSERAVAASPDILAAMEVYVQRALSRASDVLCTGHEAVRAIRARYPAILYSIARPRWQWKRLHLGLTRLWTDLVRAHRPASPLEPFDTAVLAEHAVDAAATDLLEFEYPDSVIVGLPYRRHFLFTSRDPHSAFWCHRAGAADPLRLRIATRVPSATAGQTVRLSINGKQVSTWPATARWHTVDCIAPLDLLTGGLNVIGIDWPDPDATPAQLVRQLATFLLTRAPVARGLTVDRQMHPVYGEICMLSATTSITPAEVEAARDEVSVASMR